jgi:hypothetical protein
MTTSGHRWVRAVVLTVLAGAGSLVFAGPALAEGVAGAASGSSGPGLLRATSLIAQVMLSIGAVGFVVQAARAYGGEIGKALYVAGGGVVVFAIWRLLDGASQIMNLQRPPGSIESAVYLLVTALLLAGFYMLYDTMSGHAAA